MHRTIRKSVMCIAIAAALYGQNSFAEEVGNVATLVPGKNQVELTTNKGVAIKIELLRSDVFRIWAGPPTQAIINCCEPTILHCAFTRSLCVLHCTRRTTRPCYGKS